MSRIDNWSEADRALYAVGSRAILDDLERQRQEWSAGAALDTTATDAIVREHNAKMRQLEDDHKAWLARFINGDAEEAAQDVAGGQGGAPAGCNAPATPGPVPQQPHQHAAELAEAERARAIKNMSMAEYAARRAELGVRSGTDMSRLYDH